MSNVQKSITSILREKHLRSHLTAAVFMIAIATVFVVVWSLHINGHAQTGAETVCGMNEHVHTAACYDWVEVTEDGSEAIIATESEEIVETESETAAEPEVTVEYESTKETGNSGVIGTAEETAASETAGAGSTEGTESLIETAEEEASEAITEESTAEGATEDITGESAAEEATEEVTEDAQPGDTKVVDGVEYVYTTVCELEEHTHTSECYASESVAGSVTETNDGSEDYSSELEADTDNDLEDSSSETASGGTIISYVRGLFSGGGNEEEESEVVSGAETEDANSGIATTSSGEDESETITAALLGSSAPSSVLDATMGSSGTYYYADSVKLADIDTSGATDYVVYTVIGNNYYVLDATGRLRRVNSIDSGSGISWAMDDNLGYYQWNVASVDNTDDTYTVYNSSYDKYFVPDDVSEAGDVTIKDFASNKTGKITLYGDFDLTYTFTNTGDSEHSGENWNNYVVEMYAAFTNTSSITYNTYVDVRSDAAGWLADDSGSNSYYDSGNDTLVITYTLDDLDSDGTKDTNSASDSDNEDWALWQEAMAAGASVTVDIQRTGSTVVVTSSAAGLSVEAIAYVKEYADDVPVTVYLTGEQCEITDVKYSYRDSTDSIAESSGTGNDVSIDSFDTDSTCSLNFSDNFVLEYSFYNAGSGTFNWQNYVVKIADADSSSILLYMRADNYAWVSGNTGTYSIVYGDGASDWSTWLSNMTGTNVTVEIIRNGGTITATMTAAGESFTMVVYVADFEGETLTVCLTGEQCTLSNLSYSSYESSNARTSEVSGNTVITLETVSDTYAWTASASGLGDSYTLRSQITTGYIEWVNSDGEYLQVCDSSTASELTFYFAKVRSYTVYFDGSNGGLGMYAAGTQTTVASAEMDSTGKYFLIPVPEGVLTNRYAYSLRGWYDIYNNIYCATGYDYDADTSPVMMQIPYNSEADSYSSVCYADWGVESYVFGAGTDTDLVSSVDISGFTSTTLFDYNDLFNLYSADFDGSFSTGTHSETWEVSGLGGSTVLSQSNGLKFIFMFSLNPRGTIAYMNGRDTYNGAKQDTVHSGIVTTTSSILDYLFGTTEDYVDYDASTESGVFGKTTVGNADGLFQYSSDTGYYYYDSSLNAAKYNEMDECFYLYSSPVKVTDVDNDNSDFLPFNMGSVGRLWVNYWFGMKTDIEFYLPDDTGTYDNESGSYGNQASTTNSSYSDMVFRFKGDDDVWVFLDRTDTSEGTLLLDMGGIHDAMYGEIDFSEGVVRIVESPNSTFTYNDGSDDYTETVVIYQDGIVQINPNLYKYLDDSEQANYVIETSFATISAGAHTLTFYYLERGASQSNAAIYFNISSGTYNLELTKWAEETGTKISDDAKFTYYTDQAMTTVAALQDADGNVQSEFSAGSTAYNLRIGRTYYISETTVPDGYTSEGRYFSVCLNKAGVLTIIVYDSSGDVLEKYTYSYNSTECVWNTETNSSAWHYITADVNDSDITYLTYTDGSSEGVPGIYNIGFIVQNTKTYELPSTGSIGTFPYRRMGGTFVLIAGIGLIATAFYEPERVRRRGIHEAKIFRMDSAEGSRVSARTWWHPRKQYTSQARSRDRPPDSAATRF